MTKKEAVVIEAYTGVGMLTGEDRNLFYKYINQLMGRKVYMYEILALEREIKEKAEPDFLKICKNVGKKTKARKFRAMTKGEWCNQKCPECEYNYSIFCCDYSEFNGIPKGLGNSKPYKKRNGKYILVEVKE